MFFKLEFKHSFKINFFYYIIIIFYRNVSYFKYIKKQKQLKYFLLFKNKKKWIKMEKFQKKYVTITSTIFNYIVPTTKIKS